MSNSNEEIPMESKNESIRKNVESVSIKIDAKTMMNEKNSVMSFHNLVYEVGVKSGCCKKQPKTVVKGVRYVVNFWYIFDYLLYYCRSDIKISCLAQMIKGIKCKFLICMLFVVLHAQTLLSCLKA